MRQFTTKHTVYTFDELTDNAQATAIEKLADINIDYDWWDFIYEDASQIGLDLTGFDLYRHEIDGRLTDDLMAVVDAIKAEHGPDTDTHKTALDYEQKWTDLVAKFSDGVQLDRVADDPDKQDEFDELADELTDEFQHDLLEDYRVMLSTEYEYRTSEEAIIETIEANEYEFYADGRMA